MNIYVGNLSYQMTESDLRSEFEKFGYESSFDSTGRTLKRLVLQGATIIGILKPTRCTKTSMASGRKLLWFRRGAMGSASSPMDNGAMPR